MKPGMFPPPKDSVLFAGCLFVCFGAIGIRPSHLCTESDPCAGNRNRICGHDQESDRASLRCRHVHQGDPRERRFGFAACVVAGYVSHRELRAQSSEFPRGRRAEPAAEVGTNRQADMAYYEASRGRRGDPLSDLSTQLNDQMADVAPPTMFMYVVGQKHVPCSTSTTLRPAAGRCTGLEKKATAITRATTTSSSMRPHSSASSSPRFRGRRRAALSGVQPARRFNERASGNVGYPRHR